MSTDNGMTARIEAWFVSQLTALKYEGETVFKTVDHWRGQIGIGKSGIESFERFAPWAYVKYQPVRPEREGDYDLNRKLRIAVALGQSSREAGIARIGSGTKLGISIIQTLVTNLFEGVHPGEGFTCDEFNYTGDAEIVDQPKRCGIELYFEANYLVT
jgi:hypothetical protein